ncbi:MAG: Crp/Fnr family transcriptional regulator [Chitinophagaceae bacterium]|jgi:CRP-like cAMP-binding protein|uniref:Crp/Fnr family transcriptional regulator n=1 Tax=unclassified Paraflavitalea TaxID=2798305 RepID=UPI003D33B992|nr:Crp/Fnr family transcriptional regulator [Chitinophagaceae bacterium]
MYELILKNISRFVTLTPEEIQYFTSTLKEKKLKKRQFLVQEGDVCRSTYFVNKGCLRSYYTDKDGVEHNIQFSIEDWWAGDMASFITQKPSKISVIALEDSDLLVLDRQVQEDVFAKIPKFERFFRNLLQNAFVSAQERILANLSETAEERYLNFRKKYPEMDRRLPQNQIASFLGVTPESLSRIRRAISEKRG